MAQINDGSRDHGPVSFQDNKAIGEKYGIHPRDVESKKYFFISIITATGGCSPPSVLPLLKASFVNSFKHLLWFGDSSSSNTCFMYDG